MTGGYGADVYLEATGHPSAVGQGLNLFASSAVRRVQRLWQRRHRRLVDHQRRQGTRRTRRSPGSVLLAGRHPDD